jgi:dGTPase
MVFGEASQRGGLAPYATFSNASRGRLFEEPGSATRSEFQRDRDRIVHATAFRRLQHKTQVFVEHEGDHFRTRLTHSLEVAQIARSIARALRVDEDLAEAVSLAHDLGHSPFGHAGERALDACMADYGGFDHNAQSLRIVTRLEGRYAAFDGLNLSWEALEALVKHNGPLLNGEGRGIGAYAQKPVPGAIIEFDQRFPLDLSGHSGLEGQVAALSDDIAYNAHDLDDGVRAGLFALNEIAEAVPLIRDIVAEVDRRHPATEPSRRAYETTRRLITGSIEDLLGATAAGIETSGFGSAEDVRAAGKVTARHSEGFTESRAALFAFLFERMYRHKRVMAIMERAEGLVRALFDAFFEDPARLPPDWSRGVDMAAEDKRARRVADYIAGMTDRYARAEYTRLFDRSVELR